MSLHNTLLKDLITKLRQIKPLSKKSKVKGGRNTEFLLALLIKLKNTKNFSAIACDTDGIDGTGNNAGAFINNNTYKRAYALKITPEEYLKNHNSYDFFLRLNDLIISGPTLTNINDFRAILVE